MKKAVLKMSTSEKIQVVKCRNREKLLNDLKEAASCVALEDIQFVLNGNDIIIEGMKPISFLDSTSTDEDKRNRLKTWIKWCSHLSKMGYEIQ